MTFSAPNTFRHRTNVKCETVVDFINIISWWFISDNNVELDHTKVLMSLPIYGKNSTFVINYDGQPIFQAVAQTVDRNMSDQKLHFEMWWCGELHDRIRHFLLENR